MAGHGDWNIRPVTPTRYYWTSSPGTHRRQPPWLLLPQGNGERSSSSNRLSFADALTDKKHHVISLAEPLPTPWRCRGSSQGRLVIIAGNNAVILNPVTGEKLNLPPVNRFNSPNAAPDLIVKKVILSDSPNRNPNFTALAIFSEKTTGSSNLAFCRSGQDHWALIPETNVDDAVYLEGKFYTVSMDGSVSSCDVSCNPPKIEDMEISGLGLRVFNQAFYLATACGDLLLVSRFFAIMDANIGGYKTNSFEVFKLSSCESGKKWERVPEFRDGTLFVGGSCCSSALRPSEFPGCHGNSIHYAEDDCHEEPLGCLDEHDMGFFCLKKEKCYRFPCENYYKRVSPAAGNPIWFQFQSV